jgi:hypothetical protein
MISAWLARRKAPLGKLGQSIDQARYSTWNEAVEGHAKICEQVRKGEIGE